MTWQAVLAIDSPAELQYVLLDKLPETSPQNSFGLMLLNPILVYGAEFVNEVENILSIFLKVCLKPGCQ